MSKGRTLRIFLVDGSASGIVAAEIMNWTGQVMRLPRSMLASYLTRPDSTRTGVYILTGPEIEDPDRFRVYIGESDNVGARLKQHVEQGQKEWWDTAYAITSKDGNITKSHALYLESLMIRNARSSDKHLIENIQTGSVDRLPESDQSDMQFFCEQAEIMLSILGLDLSKPQFAKRDSSIPSDSSASSVDLLPSPNLQVSIRDDKQDVAATGVEMNGSLLVFSGSTATLREHTVNSYDALRTRLINEGVLEKASDRNALKFTKDHIFTSPSAASAVILNRNDNGRESWKTPDGRSLNQWYRDQVARAGQSEPEG